MRGSSREVARVCMTLLAALGIAAAVQCQPSTTTPPTDGGSVPETPADDEAEGADIEARRGIELLRRDLDQHQRRHPGLLRMFVLCSL